MAIVVAMSAAAVVDAIHAAADGIDPPWRWNRMALTLSISLGSQYAPEFVVLSSRQAAALSFMTVDMR